MYIVTPFYMKFSLFLWFLVLFGLVPIQAQTPALTVAQCRDVAMALSPLQQKILYAQQINLLQIKQIQSNYLPRIQLGAQASWQSDVFGLPFSFPGSDLPTIPQDQYKVTLEVSQRIWDGGTDQVARKQRDLEQSLAGAQVALEVFPLREVVTDLFFKTLLLQESETVFQAAQKDLETRLKQAEAAVTEGVALRTSADQVRIQLLKNQQQIDGVQSDKQALLQMLAKWIGRENLDFTLKTEETVPSNSFYESNRPEYILFDLQKKNFQLGKEALALRTQPRFEAFLQGGVGRPNPFNFFETGFSPFAILGLKAVWAPIDWGTRRRESQVLDYQVKNTDAQRAAFDQKLAITTLKDQQEAAKWQSMLEQDKAIMALQSDIIRRADAQVKNGVMTMTDYLAQMSLLTQAHLTQTMHEVQAAQAKEMQKARLGN